MGGLKSIAALVLIKIKIVLVVAALVAVVVFTVKYLLGNTDLFSKAHIFGSPQPPPTLAYVPLGHETVYGYDNGKCSQKKRLFFFFISFRLIFTEWIVDIRKLYQLFIFT